MVCVLVGFNSQLNTAGSPLRHLWRKLRNHLDQIGGGRAWGWELSQPLTGVEGPSPAVGSTIPKTSVPRLNKTVR